MLKFPFYFSPILNSITQIWDWYTDNAFNKKLWNIKKITFLSILSRVSPVANHWTLSYGNHINISTQMTGLSAGIQIFWFLFRHCEKDYRSINECFSKRWQYVVRTVILFVWVAADCAISVSEFMEMVCCANETSEHCQLFRPYAYHAIWQRNHCKFAHGN